jgi:predicted component of type VI protein secretion system
MQDDDEVRLADEPQPDAPQGADTPSLTPDDAYAACVQLIQNLQGSDHQRRQVVDRLREQFGG